jgi:hypothetical protein
MKRLFFRGKSFHWKLIYINFIIFAIGIIFLELFFGDWIKDDSLNHLMLIRNSDWVFRIEDSHPYSYDKKFIHYSRDKWGLRGEGFERPNEIKMLTIGGSTTDQRYINEGETWQDVMSKALKDRGINFPVANAGVDGHSTFGHILALQTWLSQIEGLEPKFIGFYLGINDMLRTSADVTDKNLGYYYDDGLHFIRKIMQKSALYHVFRVINGIIVVKSKKAGHSQIHFSELHWETEIWNRQKIEEYFVQFRGALTEYESRIELLCTLTKNFGSIPIFITQANSRGFNRGQKLKYSREYGTDGRESPYRLYVYNETMMNACRKCSDAICIDLARELSFVPSDYYDSSHNTPTGARKIGSYLANKMAEVPR